MKNNQLKEVLDIFSEISKIPRCSKNEDRISKFLVNFALENNLEYKIDNYNNVLIKVPASEGYQNLPGIIIQTHMDMVCEKDNDSKHDFSKDPLELIFDGDFIKANGTTLGADDGIGMSIALSFAKLKDIPHPPLELLFTVDEETGLTGAKMLQENFLSYNYMLNIDTDDDKTFIIGCAGGKDVKIEIKTNFIKLNRENIKEIFNNNNYFNYFNKIDLSEKNLTLFEIKIDNLFGGHSGLDINKKRGNALIILIRILKYLYQNNIYFLLSSINGGHAHNAIPRASNCKLLIPSILEEKLIENFNKIKDSIIGDIIKDEPNIEINIIKINKLDLETKDLNNNIYILNFEDSIKTINILNLIPHGVFTMSSEIPGLVESSNNFAKINTNYENSSFELLLSYRSSNDIIMDWALSKIQSIAELFNLKIEIGNGYPSWKPEMDLKFLNYCKESYKDCFNVYPKVDVIHAGLECGIIKSKYKNMEIISCGVELHSPHSPKEKVSISSIERTLKFINKLFQNWKNYF